MSKTETLRVLLRKTQLRFQLGNAKIPSWVHTFSIPSGWSCPFAKDCFVKANRKTGKLKRGPHMQFQCFSATQEAAFPSVRVSRWHNFDLLRKCKTQADMRSLIMMSHPRNVRCMRIHVSGDFFSQAYFDAWCDVARAHPHVRYYAYTKSLPYWVARLGAVPDNLVLTASLGGRFDDLIDKHGLRCARVVFSENEARGRGLQIDHDDSRAMSRGPDFALLIHGQQPKGSKAAEAVRENKKKGWYGYGKRR